MQEKSPIAGSPTARIAEPGELFRLVTPGFVLGLFGTLGALVH